MFSYHQIVYLIHILFVAPLLIYVGVKREKVDKRLFELLIVIGAIVLLHHGYRLYKSFSHYGFPHPN